MNTFQLTCFLTAAEYLNFTQAAQHLHVTHPAVSQQIQSLEKELNVKLFDRSTRSVRLTEEGKAFLNDAQQIVNISEQAKRRFSSSAPSENITFLTLGCSSFSCMLFLSDALQMLHTLYPDLHPQLQIIPFKHIYKALEDGELDAVVSAREDTGLKIHALYREIAKVPMVCICPSGHPFANRKEVSMNDLKNVPLALLISSKEVFFMNQLQNKLMGDRPLSMLYLCETTDSIIALVKSGYSVSILPEFLVPDIPAIAKIPFTDADPVSLGIYYKSIQGRPEIKAFIQCARKSMSTGER